MLQDIKVLTELYLHSQGLLPEEKAWSDFYDELIKSASKENVGLLVDATSSDKCKYALFVDVDTRSKTCEVKDYIEIGRVQNWSDHLFWQGSGGARSDKIRNSPHKIYSKKGDFSTDNFIAPPKTILEDYCRILQNKSGKKKAFNETGPLFWDISMVNEREWLKNIIDILEGKKKEIDEQVKEEKLSLISSGESVFIGLTIDGKPLGEYELFRRYLIFVRMRVGVQDGTNRFRNKIPSDIIKELTGICPACNKEKPLLDQWQAAAELSFYQTTNENHLSYAFPPFASFKLCQGCADLLFTFKQRLLETLTRKVGGNECVVLPSIKLIPSDQKEKRRLYENLTGLWGSSTNKMASTEERLVYRLGQLPSYATVTFAFGDYITKGKSQNVRRLDELNVIFPDVLPSRLSQIATAIKQTNQQLKDIWSLTGRNRNYTWNIKDDFYLLYQLFYPSWEENRKDKSRRRPEVEHYLRAIFYGQEIPYEEIVEDCYLNLLSTFKTTRKGIGMDDNSMSNYVGNLLSLFVFLEQLKEINKPGKEVKVMPETEKVRFSFIAMPELGKFVEMHPLLKDRQYLAPFFVGCLFSYAENLQKDNSRLAAYNWLGTMALTYDDIVYYIYPKVLNYITNKEKIISSHRLQELVKAIAHYDSRRCDNDRVALTAFCHGWAVGRDFIYKKKGEKDNE